MVERSDLPGWLWPLVAIVIFGLSVEILFMTVYQDKTREMDRLAQHVADLRTKAQEGQAAHEHLDQFHNEIRELDSELAKLDRMVPQTADLAVDAEDRWLQETFATVRFRLRTTFVGELEERDFVASRQTSFNFSKPTRPERLDELLQALEQRRPAHSLVSLLEERHPAESSTYQFVLEVSAVRQAPHGGR